MSVDDGMPIENKSVILAIDPGGTTGWCLWDKDDVVAHGQVDDWLKFCTFVDEILHTVTEIVIETYVITMETVKKSRQYEALFIIGVMNYFGQRCGIDVTIQSRSIKAFATDDKLKALGWYWPGEQHARDAARHMLAFVWAKELIEPERIM